MWTVGPYPSGMPTSAFRGLWAATISVWWWKITTWSTVRSWTGAEKSKTNENVRFGALNVDQESDMVMCDQMERDVIDLSEGN